MRFRATMETQVWACLWGIWGIRASEVGSEVRRPTLNMGRHHSMGWGPSLNKNEKVSPVPAFITVCFLTGCNVTGCLKSLPWCTVPFANWKEPFFQKLFPSGILWLQQAKLTNMGAFLHRTPSHQLNPELADSTRLAGQEAPGSSPISVFQHRVTGAQCCAQPFMWVLGIQAQVLMLNTGKHLASCHLSSLHLSYLLFSNFII